MSRPTIALHTNADGSRWWGDMTHGAHLDKDGKFIPNTEWAVSCTNKISPDDALAKLYQLAYGKLHSELATGLGDEG